MLIDKHGGFGNIGGFPFVVTCLRAKFQLSRQKLSQEKYCESCKMFLATLMQKVAGIKFCEELVSKKVAGIEYCEEPFPKSCMHKVLRSWK